MIRRTSSAHTFDGSSSTYLSLPYLPYQRSRQRHEQSIKAQRTLWNSSARLTQKPAHILAANPSLPCSHGSDGALERTIRVVTHCKPTQPLAAGLSCSVDDCSIHRRPTGDDQESAAVWLASWKKLLLAPSSRKASSCCAPLSACCPPLNHGVLR